MLSRFSLICCLLAAAWVLNAQETFPVNGAKHPSHPVHAFINATIYCDYETILKNATLLVRDDKILAVGEKIEIPKGAIVHNLQGKFIYPSFIDLYSDYGMPEVKTERQPRQSPQMQSNQKGAYGWNQAIRADVEAHKLYQNDKDQAEAYKKAGFGLVLSHQRDGIVRGSAVLVALSSKKENECILRDKAAAWYSFNKGSSSQDYPTSLTGAIALLRQTHYDAQWYAASSSRKEYNISLEAFNSLQSLPLCFDAGDKHNALRAAELGREFGKKFLIKAGGNEYQRIADMKDSRCTFILPLNFPEAFDVQDPFEAEAIPFEDLKHWELAPGNPSAFERNLIPFCLTAADLSSRDQFLKQLRLAHRYGLSEKAALKALTHQPAQLMGLHDRIGAVKSGYLANFFISDQPIFNEKAQVMEHWTLGEATTYADPAQEDLRGEYRLQYGNKNIKVILSGDPVKPEGKWYQDSLSKKFTVQCRDGKISFSMEPDSMGQTKGSGLRKSADSSFYGRLQDPRGNWSDFTMTKVAAEKEKELPAASKSESLSLGQVIYPFKAYGSPVPEAESGFAKAWQQFKNRYSAILIKNATVWTNCGDTILYDHDVYVVEGKIVRVAPNIDAPKLAFAKVIDAKGKHLTPGIIDEHSHIALSGGVNEAAEASSAEVRMADVINPDDVNIYRQLAGGVTTSQLLHGSANPIGGQSALIKLRWGQNAAGLKYENAPPFIKFALGENVKQSNWGDRNTVRFPQSRMGVEQVYADFFSRAKAYKETKNKAGSKEVFRKDLELEALSEILDNKRFITCHSYVQSEINMLLHLADSMKFKVNTFTHILEGYKVADKLKQHGAYASTFSDWWAYKNEVMDAIPYNAALLTRAGVVTAVNSDDAEMARRLNQEAAKAMKYGGLSETEALKLVTLNPATMLHIDDKVGRIRPGKVADLVLWSDHPLSVYAIAEKTIIDGQIYFDRDEDRLLRTYMREERARLLNKMQKAKQDGAPTRKAKTKVQRLYHCDSLEEHSVEEETQHD